MIFLTKKLLFSFCSLFAVLTIFSVSGCGFPTVILSDSDAPDVTFAKFISALKSSDYDTADSLLADNATIRPQNNTGYAFFDEYSAVSLEYFDYSVAGDPVFDGPYASLTVNVTSLDKKALLEWLGENLSRIEEEYMTENSLPTIDIQNKSEVDKVLSKALREYASIGEKNSETITVRFIFDGGIWKIQGDDSLVKAIYGGVSDED